MSDTTHLTAELLTALEKAIRAMNCVPGFDTGIHNPETGRNPGSYALLRELEAVARKAREAQNPTR